VFVAQILGAAAGAAGTAAVLGPPGAQRDNNGNTQRDNNGNVIGNNGNTQIGNGNTINQVGPSPWLAVACWIVMMMPARTAGSTPRCERTPRTLQLHA
jgi:hypothetical protein